MWKIASLFWLLVAFGVNDVHLNGEGIRWTITTKTGDKEHADTNADVFIILIDPNGQNSKPLRLDELWKDDFERGDTNTFRFRHWGDFKEVCSIRIYHDNSGDSPGWYLRWVEVKSEEMTVPRKFIVNDWVPTQEEESNVNFVIQRTPPCRDGPLP
ncbi:lipoxygenase homology domain-containing protein 1-like [Pomacea canaliculata]|uniref:lipoxygenase homology domain-containing protein 1-like n=1 Tax=Pomacea canaliculata TaxID=400727 RepID=UPI000D72F980|nr:lipoxygenase homology domain-containing protein 1-like [Pomacea canaliculata]